MKPAEKTNDTYSGKKLNWIQSIGPGIVTACVVIGPGSILTSSKVGSTNGYSYGWIVILSAVFMLTYIYLAAKLAAVSQQSNGDLVRKYAGGWLAKLIGVSVFMMTAGYQFGHNLAIHSVLSSYLPGDYWILVFNFIALLFIFGFKNLYSALETLMVFLVALMLGSFAVNLFFAKPDLDELALGFLPNGLSDIGLPLLGLIGTTFGVSAAYYQSYLVRFKGWKQTDLKKGIADARLSGIIMALITLMLMTTAAAVLRDAKLNSPIDIGNALYPLFGEKGRIIFCLGLFSAAFSSFIVNSMIGGYILSDGFGLGSSQQDRLPRFLTGAVLLVGMLVSLYAIKLRLSPLEAIVAAQAASIIASPVVAGVLLWLTNHSDIMAENKNGIWINLLAGTGFAVLLVLAFNTAVYQFYPMILSYFNNV